MHNSRKRRHGTPTPAIMRASPGELGRWLDEHLAGEPTDECMLWPFACDTSGYPRRKDPEIGPLVTHQVLVRTQRPRPTAPNDIALHSCDTPACLNPRHLSWGSHQRNAVERELRGRSKGKNQFNIRSAEGSHRT